MQGADAQRAAHGGAARQPLHRASTTRAVGETPEFDPSMAAIRPPYTAMMSQYVRSELNYKSDLTYYILGGGIGPWEWGSASNGFADVSRIAARGVLAQPRHAAIRRFAATTISPRPTFATELHALAPDAGAGRARARGHAPVRSGPHDVHPRRRAGDA